ncbi:MAG TPA: IS66 family transposase [Stellaceae bacterium]|nr:IS66 family transposase [Stellaceae bacterium]
MTNAAAELPDDPEALKAMVLAARAETAAMAAEAEALRAANGDVEARLERLYALLKALGRARYGRRSEALDADQHAFAFEEVQTGLGALEAKLDATVKAPRERAPRRRKPLPAHLERVEVVIEPEMWPCACGSCERVKIGEDVSERLDVVPARFRVIVTRRPRYACVTCRESVVQALASPHLIEAGVPTEGLLAHIAVSKYADGLPLYRQEAIYGRDRVELGRNLMAGWMGRVGFHLEPLAERVLHHIRAGERIFADETTLPTLAPGAGKAKTAWLWAYARDDRPFGGVGPPMVAYRFEDSRGAECLSRHLAGFSGLLQSDGYGAYRQLADPGRAGGPVTLAACWAHLRRKFYELHVAGLSETATWTVERMAALWGLEQEIRGRSPEERQIARRQAAAPIVAELFERWEGELTRIPGKSKLAEALRYARARRAELERFLHDGRLDIDNNTVERAIRPQTITRKNALFAGSDGGGRTWATIATLLATAKLDGVDPYPWLKLTLERIAGGWPNRDIDALMPWNYNAA